MNQDNKISSLCPGTINIELGLDLYVLLYYRGLRSVDIYRLQSAHTENNREPGVHCNKKTTSIASNYAFHFHRALNSRLCIFLNAPASGGTPSPDPLSGLCPWTSLGDFRPQTPDLAHAPNFTF